MATKDIQPEYRVYKVCVLGPKKSGKTSFINCLMNKWGTGQFPSYSGDTRPFCLVGCLQPEDFHNQKPYFMLFQDMIGINDSLIKDDPELRSKLLDVIENSNVPDKIELTKFPWEQDTRHYSAFIFIIDSCTKDKQTITGLEEFIKQIVTREEFKIGGKYPKFKTKKIIVRTHKDIIQDSSQQAQLELTGIKEAIKTFDVSCTTGENVMEVLKELLEQLKNDSAVEAYENYVWLNNDILQKPKEEQNEEKGKARPEVVKSKDRGKTYLSK